MNGMVQHPSVEPQAEHGGGKDRREQRFTLLIRAAKLVAPSGEFLCILRDASTGGVRIQVFHSLPPEKTMVLELPNGSCYDVEVVWQRDGQAGLAFASQVEILQLVNDRVPHPKRQIRLSVQLPALVTAAELSAAVVIRNLSQQGARIESPVRLALDQKLQLKSDLLEAVEARVRWRKEAEYGLVFDQTFRFDQLALIAARLQLSDKSLFRPSAESERAG